MSALKIGDRVKLTGASWPDHDELDLDETYEVTGFDGDGDATFDDPDGWGFWAIYTNPDDDEDYSATVVTE